jgi:NADH:ubiquinone oxidoreductase subunit 3 (subunit A)
MNPEYIIISNIILVIVLLACILLFLSYILNYQENNFVKLSSYECGFQPFEDSRQSFNIEFYLVGILFVIFDLEIVFLFPLCLCLKLIGFFGFFWAYFFIIILTIGFIYEWLKGGLDW